MKLYKVIERNNNKTTTKYFVNKNEALEVYYKIAEKKNCTGAMLRENTNKQKALELLRIGRTEKAAKQILKDNESLSAKEIIKTIKDNGGLDLRFIEYAAKQDNLTNFEYTIEFVKNNYDCHKNTARAVAKYFIWF